MPDDKARDQQTEKSGSDGFRVSRRAFLGISAGAAVAIGAAAAIKWPKADSSATGETLVEGLGEEKWVSTSCLNCPTRCAVNVRVVKTNGDDTWRVLRIVGMIRGAW
ncbi:MAG: hypothetical protein NTU41_04090 [Chloroflexi bacterium]|nr:hypothetical protein [Chloroflexota bacterium]